MPSFILNKKPRYLGGEVFSYPITVQTTINLSVTISVTSVMKTRLIISGVGLAMLTTVASLAQSRQYANTALQFADITQSGSARYQGVGGNHASLGGDASNIAGNPAGLGFYNRSEISLSPSFYNVGTESTYLGTTGKGQKSNPNLSQFSLVLAGEPSSTYNSRLRRTTFGVSYQRQNNLNNQFSYGGTNNAGSLIDDVLELANDNRVPVRVLDEDFNNGRPLSIESAFYSLYLIDPLSDNGPYRRPVLLAGRSAVQTGNYATTGFTSQWTFAYSGNFEDRLYLGISGGFSRVSYNRRNELSERYPNGGAFRGIDYREDATITGNGFFLAAGAIFKPTTNIQLGASIHSPQWSTMQFTYEERISADILNNQVPIFDAGGRPVTNAQGQQAFDQLNTNAYQLEPFDFQYNMTSPLRAQGGATVFFGRKGFLTASAEYVGYQGIRLSTTNNSDFKANNTRIVKSSFKNVINFRVGGEARLKDFRVRAGVGYLPNPYSENYETEGRLDRSRLYFSGGLGYRNQDFFVDLAGTLLQSKDAFAPYALNNPANYFSAQLDRTMVNMTLSAGIFF
jgi:hypothetical protein